MALHLLANGVCVLVERQAPDEHAASSPDIKTGELNVRVDVMEGPARWLHGFVEPPEDVELPEIDEVPEPGADD